jgi:hypothetical protein
MTSLDFVNAIRIEVEDSTVAALTAMLQNSSEQPPAERGRPLFEWYKRLDESDLSFVQEIIRETAEQAVFSFLTMLDGMSIIENDVSKGRLELYYLKGNDRILLNDPAEEELHNVFNQVLRTPPNEKTEFGLRPFEVGPADDLKARAKLGDGVDIHHVPQKYPSMKNIKNYDPETAPAIALPKHQHRKMPPA